MYIDLNIIIAFLIFAAVETTVIMAMANNYFDGRRANKQFDKHYETIVR